MRSTQFLDLDPDAGNPCGVQVPCQFEKIPQHHKPFLAGIVPKQTPIGYDFHQVFVQDYVPQSKKNPPTEPGHKISYDRPSSKAVFLKSQTDTREIQAYLSFIEAYFEDKIPDYFQQGLATRERTRSQALNFLHKMNYNYTRAKFYTVFPYYLNYNHYRSHDPLVISDRDMEITLHKHIQGLKNTKEKDFEKWAEVVTNLIDSGVHLLKLNAHLDFAKQNKYDVPEAIREQIQKALKVGKQLKKTLTTKLPIDRLIARREQLSEFKITTNDMIQFVETVGRCEEWLKKQQRFEQAYFTKEFQLLPRTEKIEFKVVQALVNQFNNLPLAHETFEETTLALYEQTMNLLEKMPVLNKIARTRTAQSSGNINSKAQLDVIREYQAEVEKCPVEHEEFIVFECHLNDSLEWIERIGMFLEDQRTEKTLKLLGQYSKIINDNPIQNQIQPKLQSRLEYYETMEKIKKDIANPAKYEQIKQAIKKLKDKGYEPLQYTKLEHRFVTYIGWHESQQLLHQPRILHSHFQLLASPHSFQTYMVNEADFLTQFHSAKNQMLISQQVSLESQSLLNRAEELKIQIRRILAEGSSLRELIEIVEDCIRLGFIFQQFLEAHSKLVECIKLVAQMRFFVGSGDGKSFSEESLILSEREIATIVQQVLDDRMTEIKDISRLKDTGDQISANVLKSSFLQDLPETILFNEFMSRTHIWTAKAERLVAEFKTKDGIFDIRQIIEESKSCLVSNSLIDELNRIDLIVKWREKISKKINDSKQNPFNWMDQVFMQAVEIELKEIQQVVENQERMRQKAIEFLWKYREQFSNLLTKIAGIEIESPYKLSEINKFCKQIDREIQKYKLEDSIVMSLRQKLQNELLLSDEWKERYLAIKRFEKKKLNRKEDEEPLATVNGEGEGEGREEDLLISKLVVGMPYVPMLFRLQNYENDTIKKKYYIRNGEFCWYFKLALMIFEFYNGYQLKFSIEELVKLKTTLTDIHKFILRYNLIFSKEEPSDADLQALENQGVKFPVFFREIYILSQKNLYVSAWKDLAGSVIKSVPVVNMELKARKPEELLEILQNQKLLRVEEPKCEQKTEELGISKRKRKQNSFYNNDDIALITDDTFGAKSKKKKKGFNSDTEYRNNAVASNAKKQANSLREDQQRTQALLNGEVPADMIQIDDPKEYCICRYGVPNENSVMIQCEWKCEEWFHIECLGIKRHQAKNDIQLKCPGCRSLYQINEPGSFSIWDTQSKISEYAFRQIVEEGRKLCVQTNELKKIELINSRMLAWKQGVKEIERKIGMGTRQVLTESQVTLYELFLQSLWLPTFHPETRVLKKLLLLARNE